MGISSRIKEILSDPQLRSWLFFKAFHPGDNGVVQTHGIPSYLDHIKKSLFNSFRVDIELPALVPLVFDENKKSIELTLASSSFSVTLDELDQGNGISYLQERLNECQDIEDVEALFRFSFLMHAMEKSATFGPIEQRLVKDWFELSENIHGGAWSPYTIAERMANIGVFLCRSGSWKNWDENFKSVFQNAIIKESKRLFKELEYLGEELTCNHLSNNGRGLMWAGLLVNHKPLIKLGATIMAEEFKRIVQPDGMLREGSTHYQLLITRNYYEAWWILKQAGVNESSLEFESFYRMLHEASCFVILKDKHPLIGDISPDFFPDWFLDVLHIERKGEQAATGWASHFVETVCRKNFSTEGKFLLKDDFVRFDNQNFSLLSHVNLNGMPILAGHAHCDTGAPVIHYKGEELLIDLGRKNYTPDSRHYLMANSHNTLTVDDEPLEYLPRGVFGKQFKSKISQGGPEVELGEKFTLRLKGFRRLGVNLIREIFVDSNAVTFLHKISGKGKHKIRFFFHTPENSKAEFIWPEGGKYFKNPSLRSKRYGHEENAITHIWEKSVSLPCELLVQIKAEAS